MKKIIFLVVIFLGVLCLSSVYCAQMSTMDRFRMQQQSEQFKMKANQFKNQVQEKSQQTIGQAQEIVQEDRENVAAYQAKETDGMEIFDKYAQQEQRPNFTTMIKLYGIPILIIAIIGIGFFIIWHQCL